MEELTHGYKVFMFIFQLLKMVLSLKWSLFFKKFCSLVLNTWEQLLERLNKYILYGLSNIRTSQEL